MDWSSTLRLLKNYFLYYTGAFAPVHIIPLLLLLLLLLLPLRYLCRLITLQTFQDSLRFRKLWLLLFSHLIKNNYSAKWRVVGINGITGESGEGIFNGDTGIISRVNTFDHTLTVTFDDDREVEYEKESLDEIELSYAITIHKSQGSEYPAVIIPLFDVPKMLTSRNLLYTAVSRGTKCVMIMGDFSVVRKMTETLGEQKRYTTLSLRLNEVL